MCATEVLKALDQAWNRASGLSMYSLLKKSSLSRSACVYVCGFGCLFVGMHVLAIDQTQDAFQFVYLLAIKNEIQAHVVCCSAREGLRSYAVMRQG
jgi:hypothetical protein